MTDLRLKASGPNVGSYDNSIEVPRPCQDPPEGVPRQPRRVCHKSRSRFVSSRRLPEYLVTLWMWRDIAQGWLEKGTCFGPDA